MCFIQSLCTERERAHPRMVFVCKWMEEIVSFELAGGGTGVARLRLLSSRFALFFFSERVFFSEAELESGSHLLFRCISIE
jgi:hypothetical protein